MRVRADGTQSYEPVARYDATQGKYVTVPLDLGPSNELVILVLFGTGFRNRRDQAEVGVRIGGVEAPVQYAAAAPGFAGLDQLNVVVPRALIGRGEVDVALRVEGRAANFVAVNIR